MEKTFASYLAGMLDGEGCFLLEKYPIKRNLKNGKVGHYFSWKAAISLGQTNKQYLEHILNKVNIGGNIIGKHPHYQIIWSNRMILKVVPQILPYLIIKKEQAKLLLDACILLKNHRHNKHANVQSLIQEYSIRIKSLKPCNQYTKEPQNEPLIAC